MSELIEAWRMRLATRGASLATVAIITAVYVVLGGLEWRWAASGMIAAILWAGLWPGTASPAETVVEQQATEQVLGPAPLARDFGERDWQVVLQAIPEPTVLLTATLTISGANSVARDLLNLRPGHHLSAGLRSPDLMAAIEQAKISGQPQSADVHIAVPVERLLHVRVSPITGGAAFGGLLTLLLVFRDRTDEQQLAQLRADFVANASHELRTPLASVKGFIETLQGPAKEDPAARERFLGIMHEQASRMSRLIEDLLSLSRIEMREHVLPRDSVDLSDVVEQVGRALDPLAQRAGQRLMMDLAARPAVVLGDRDELIQLTQNLIQNAIKYGKKGGRIDVKVALEGARVVVSVVDDGIGIAPEHLPRLTERFYRVSAKDSRERGGTGLGLAIVKHIANRHQGDLRIESQMGMGSTFTVLFPLPGGRH